LRETFSLAKTPRAQRVSYSATFIDELLFCCGTPGFLRLVLKMVNPKHEQAVAGAFTALFGRIPRFSACGITVAQYLDRRMKVMAAILAIGAGLVMTAVGVAIAWLVIEITLLALSQALAATPLNPINEPGAGPVVIQFKNSENNVSTVEWAEEAA
jgi:hypothetical protein